MYIILFSYFGAKFTRVRNSQCKTEYYWYTYNVVVGVQENVTPALTQRHMYDYILVMMVGLQESKDVRALHNRLYHLFLQQDLYAVYEIIPTSVLP